MYYVYILTNKTNRVLYVGVTNNLERRLYEHKNKMIEGFTKKYNINKLVYFETTSDINSALNREKTLKNLVRRKKEELINISNSEWKDLSVDLGLCFWDSIETNVSPEWQNYVWALVCDQNIFYCHSGAKR